MKKKIINSIIKEGKKRKATYIYKNVCEYISKKYNLVGNEVINQGVLNSLPVFEIKTIRKSNGISSMPVLSSQDRKVSLTIRRFIKEAKKVKGSNFVENFSEEIYLSYNKRGTVYSKKLEDYKIANNSRVLLFDLYKK